LIRHGNIISILVIGIASILSYLLISHTASVKLDENYTTLVLEVTASIIGISLIAIKEMKDADKVIVESLEVLVLIIMADVAVFPYLSKPFSNLIYASILIMLTTGGWWAFYVLRRFITVKENEILTHEYSETKAEEKYKKRFKSVTYFLEYIIGLGVVIVIIVSIFTPK